MSLCESAAEDLEDLPQNLQIDKTTHIEWELNLSTWVEAAAICSGSARQSGQSFR